MSRHAAVFTAALMAGSLSIVPAWAQAPTAPPAADGDVSAMVEEFRQKFGPALDTLGVSPEAFDRRFAPLVRAAVPAAPATGEWGFSLGFKLDTSSYDRDPAEGREPLAVDAAACAAAYPRAGAVLRHRSFVREGLTGSQCAFLENDLAEPGAAVLNVELRILGEGRHAKMRYAAAASAEDDTERAVAMLSGVTDANLVLADALGDMAMDVMVSEGREKGRSDTAESFEAVLTALATGVGAQWPDLDRNELDRLLAAAVPKRPEGDTRTWGSLVDFNVDYTLGEEARRPDADGYRVLEDARGCLPQGRQAVISHFRRWSRDGLSGHVCGVSTLEDDVWMLVVTAFTEGEGRRLRATYTGSLAIDGQPAESDRLGRERLASQVALAEWAADQALTVLFAAPRD